MRSTFLIFLKLLIIITSLFSSRSAVGDSLENIPAVSQLKDIQIYSWEYQQIQRISQSYDNCAAELINRDRPISRYEFAVGLNNCLQKIDIIISQSDLNILQRLQQDFIQELALLRNKVDTTEARINQLEKSQFSTTTKLQGQVLFFLADSFGEETDNSQTFTGYRIRLDFDTSFYGRDSLKIRLESKDIGRLDRVTDTSMSRLSVDSSTDGIEIGELSYTFMPADNNTIVIGTAGVGQNDVAEVLNPLASSSSGAISRFARRNPATLRGAGGAGIGIMRQFNDNFRGSVGYFIDSDRASNPQAGNGLFDSSASAIAQLLIKPTENFTFALTYNRNYQSAGEVNLLSSTGVSAANEPFGQKATSSDNLGLQFNWELNSKLEISGWFGYTRAIQQQGDRNSATILNTALTFVFPDLGGDSNEGGIIIGIPPTVSSHSDRDLVTDNTPLHIEALYRIDLGNDIELTPGIFTIINPDSDESSPLWVGTIRTEFSF